jgi:carbon starvation protein CstA
MDSSARHNVKQIDKESDAHAVGYGGMLAEGFVAFIALVTVMIATSDCAGRTDGRMLSAGKIYGNGSGIFLTSASENKIFSSLSHSARWRSRRSYSTHWM